VEGGRCWFCPGPSAEVVAEGEGWREGLCSATSSADPLSLNRHLFVSLGAAFATAAVRRRGAALRRSHWLFSVDGFKP